MARRRHLFVLERDTWRPPAPLTWQAKAAHVVVTGGCASVMFGVLLLVAWLLS